MVAAWLPAAKREKDRKVEIVDVLREFRTRSIEDDRLQVKPS
jgi:hypothetical protein